MTEYSFVIPQPILDSVNQRITAFVKSKGWSPGLYDDKEGQEKCFALMNFLITELVRELRHYNFQAIVYYLISKHEEVFSLMEQHKKKLNILWQKSGAEDSKRSIITLLNKASFYFTVYASTKAIFSRKK